MEDAAGRELLSALDDRDPTIIRAAMVSYADRVQGVHVRDLDATPLREVAQHVLPRRSSCRQRLLQRLPKSDVDAFPPRLSPARWLASC